MSSVFSFTQCSTQFSSHFRAISASFWSHFGVILVSFWRPWVSMGDPEVPRRFQHRFCLHFGVPLGPLGAPFGVTFRSLWPPWGPKNRKKRRTGERLFTDPISARIFFTFWVPGTPKNKDSVWEGCTKPHFRPRTKKTMFQSDFGVVLGTIWDNFADPWATFAPQDRLFSSFFSN